MACTWQSTEAKRTHASKHVHFFALCDRSSSRNSRTFWASCKSHHLSDRARKAAAGEETGHGIGKAAADATTVRFNQTLSFGVERESFHWFACCSRISGGHDVNRHVRREGERERRGVEVGELGLVR